MEKAIKEKAWCGKVTFQTFLDFFAQYGYLFILVICYCEYLNLPGFPAGIIMPGIGVLAEQSDLNLLGALVLSIAAGTLASLTIYAICRFGGAPILHKLFGLSIPVMIYVGDTALLLIQAIYSSTEQVLYGILVVLLSSIVMDKVLIMGQKQTQVVVISPQYEKINQMIHQQMDRGSTLLHATTGLEKSDQKVVMTVISNRQLAHLNELILQIDPQAFVVASEVNEVKGRGFTLSKLSKNIAEK